MAPGPVPRRLIFVDTGEKLLMFASPADASRGRLDFEAAYGARGERYEMQRARGRSALRKTRGGERPDELKALLLHYFEACEDPADATEDLSVLVERAWASECAYRARCGPDPERANRMPLWGYVLVVAIPAVILFLALRYR